MKMDIDAVNPIVKNTIYENILLPNNAKSIKEFGSFNYFINPSSKDISFAFSCLDFDKIYEFSGKEWIESEFPGKYYIN